jgi:hypothetical protein
MLPYYDDDKKKGHKRKRSGRRRSKSFYTVPAPVISVCVIIIFSFVLIFVIIFLLLPSKNNNNNNTIQQIINGPVFSSRSFTYNGAIKSIYSFKERFFLENNMKTYSFVHERLYQFDQNGVVDYELCCIVFVKSIKDSEYAEHSKICGTDSDLQCIISNNRLLVSINMSFLEEGSDVEIVLSCMFDWLSLPPPPPSSSSQSQQQQQRVDFHEKDFIGAK